MNALGKIKKSGKLIKKEIKKIDKDGNEVVVNISYKTKSIDSAKFMASSLSNLIDHLAEGIHKIKGKECDSFLEYENVKEDLIEYKYLSCNKDYSALMKKFLKKLRTHLSFIIMISMSLFCC